MPLTRMLKVTTRLGMNMRGAAYIVQNANRCKSAIRFTVGENTANAKSMMGLICLLVVPGTEVQVDVEGPDEEEAMARMSKVFAGKFGNRE